MHTLTVILVRVFALAVGLWSANVLPCYGSTPPPFAVTIAVDAGASAAIKADAGVTLKITITNVSGGAIRAGVLLGARQHAERQYDIKVWRKDGAAVPLTDYGRDVYNADSELNQEPISPIGFDLQPGAEFTVTSNLSQVYTLSESGEYFVQIIEKRPGISGYIVSNLTKFTIVQ